MFRFNCGSTHEKIEIDVKCNAFSFAFFCVKAENFARMIVIFYFKKKAKAKRRFSGLKISSYSNRIGGFASVNNGVIRDCYTDIKLKFDANAAGFVFENTGKTERTVALGSVKGKTNIG